jgi:hypothetical protein
LKRGTSLCHNLAFNKALKSILFSIVSITLNVYLPFISPKKNSMKYPESPIKPSIFSSISSGSLNILLFLSFFEINLRSPFSFLKDIIELKFVPVLLKELFL